MIHNDKQNIVFNKLIPTPTYITQSCAMYSYYPHSATWNYMPNYTESAFQWMWIVSLQINTWSPNVLWWTFFLTWSNIHDSSALSFGLAFSLSNHTISSGFWYAFKAKRWVIRSLSGFWVIEGTWFFFTPRHRLLVGECFRTGTPSVAGLVVCFRTLIGLRVPAKKRWILNDDTQVG